MKRIQRKVLNIGTYRVDKISLSCYDDKNYIIEDRYSRLSHSHKSTYQLYKKAFQLILIFSLNRTAFSSATFPRYKKSEFFLQQYRMKDYAVVNMENK